MLLCFLRFDTQCPEPRGQTLGTLVLLLGTLALLFSTLMFLLGVYQIYISVRG